MFFEKLIFQRKGFPRTPFLLPTTQTKIAGGSLVFCRRQSLALPSEI